MIEFDQDSYRCKFCPENNPAMFDSDELRIKHVNEVHVTTNESQLQCPKCLQFFKNQSSFRKHQADHYKGNIILLFSFQIVEANTCEHSFLVVQIKYGKKLSHPILLHFPFMWIPITYVHMYEWVSVPQRITFLIATIESGSITLINWGGGEVTLEILQYFHRNDIS